MIKTQRFSFQSSLFLLVIMLIQGLVVIAQDEDNDETDTLADPPILIVSNFGGTLYVAPDTNAEVLVEITASRLPIIGLDVNEQYFLVFYEGQLGWTSPAFAAVQGDLRSVPVLSLQNINDIPLFLPNSAVTLYPLPDENATISAEVEDEPLAILAIREEQDFYLVIYMEQSAWLPVQPLDGEIVGDLSTISILATPEPCIISTDQARTVRVRVGYGENRSAITFLEANVEFTVLGQNTDDNNDIWYALDKDEAAPGRSINGDVAWVAADDVNTTGDCDVVPIMEAEGIVPVG